MGMMHGGKAVDASHEPVLAPALALALARIPEIRTSRFKDTMHGHKAKGATHEPVDG
jgi:hypothetical protein